MTLYDRYLAVYCLVVWLVGVAVVEVWHNSLPAVGASVLLGLLFTKKVPADA